MHRMKFVGLIAMVASGLMGLAAQAATTPSPWEQPAAALAEQIGNLLGPGQARLTIRNLSSISTDEIPAIRRLLEQDLKARGVVASGADSANMLRVTLSENARERLWVAEVMQGSETRVAMVHVDPGAAPTKHSDSGMVLSKKRLWDSSGLGGVHGSDGSVLAGTAINAGLVFLGKESILILRGTTDAGQQQRRLNLSTRRMSSRDLRGMVLASTDGSGFTAYLAGTECNGSYAAAENKATPPEEGWTVQCHDSDDPWPIVQADVASGSPALKAFYNSARNYFTGVVTPNLGVDLPPFYSASLVPRPAANAALLIDGIDGKVLMVENGTLKPVAGARDWGSDFAVLHSGCGSGTQIVASGSGEAASDSLRAYDLPAQEAVPVSAPLAMEGTVTALWPAPDGKSVFAVVRGAGDAYEVDRVTAGCNE